MLGALCAKLGSSVYQDSREIVLNLIQQGLGNTTELVENEPFTGSGQRVSEDQEKTFHIKIQFLFPIVYNLQI